MKESTIEALKYMRGLSGTGIQNAVRDTCKKEQLNEEFINEFHEFITPEMFSTSYNLTGELINSHPDIFNVEAWKACDKRSLFPLLDDTFRRNFTDGEILEMVEGMDANDMTDELFFVLFENGNNELKEATLYKYPKSLGGEFIVKNAGVLSSRFFKGERHTAKLTNQDLEAIVKERSRTMEFLTNVLLKTKNNDVAWQTRILNEIGTKVFITKTNGTFDETIIRAMRDLHPSLADSLILNIKEYAESALSYTVLSNILKWVDLKEETIAELTPIFRRNMLANSLAHYAAEKGYASIVLMLATN